MEINRVREQIAGLLPEGRVLEAYVDVQTPTLEDVIANLPKDEPAVVVPLLLSTGYHVKVDIARAVGARTNTVAALPLGPHPVLEQVLLSKYLQAAGSYSRHSVILAAAGSSDPAAEVTVRATAKSLAKLLNREVSIGLCAGNGPKLQSTVAATTNLTSTTIIVPYLLAPGYFYQTLLEAGATKVAPPLLPDSRVARVALERFWSAAESFETQTF